MKLTRLFLLLSIVSGCTSLVPDSHDANILSHRAKLETGVNVSNTQLDLFIQANLRGRQTKSKESYYEVTPYLVASNDTAFYIVNYSEGWEIISTDKRTPPVLAHSETGRMDIEDGNENLSTWLDIMAADMMRIKQSADTALSFSVEAIAENLSMWDGPDTPVDSTTKDLSMGHYELYSRTTSYREEDVIDHLVSTHWHQYSPYNYYCPDKYRSEGKSPAGCAAVAVSQVINFLHSRTGIPEYLYSSVTCTGNNRNYLYSFSDPASDVWDGMFDTADPLHSAASLIAQTGHLLDTSYGDDASSVMTIGNFMEDCFNAYGYTFTYESYNSTALTNSLLNGYPVIASAYNHIIDFSGHIFIIDGYKTEKQITTSTYKWVDDNTHMYDSSLHPDYTNTTESAPYLKNIKMNWGWSTQWDSSHANDGWYLLTADWTTTEGTYDSRVHIAYNFNTIN